VALSLPSSVPVLIIGAGPAGLMAAEQIARAGVVVHIIDAMPSPGRKFLRAGVGGLNITHAEPFAEFLSRYSPQDQVQQWLDRFDASATRAWVSGLGLDTFVGSSGRVFPVGLKAAPLLRAWLQRLRSDGVSLHTRHRWLGFLLPPAGTPNAGSVHRVLTPDGEVQVTAQAVVFALGGGSWARLGSDGRWQALLDSAGIACVPFQPANCGFDYAWSAALLSRHEGAPLKGIALTVPASAAPAFQRKGEALISRHGIQGSLVYAASRAIRETLNQSGEVVVYWDLYPDIAEPALRAALQGGRGKDSLSNWLRKRIGLEGARLSLLYELGGSAARDPAQLPALLKHLPQKLLVARPLDQAISTAGGVVLHQLDPHLMLSAMPGVFCAGEMLDWEAPTGGYLLTASLASGVVAGEGVLGYLTRLAEPVGQ
jgi:uncharacterized flavoprotein (TIGR03862 family)